MKSFRIVPVFYVANVDVAVRYYVERLGFNLSFKYGTYAGLVMGACELHVTDPGEPRQIVGAGTAYLLCDEVDAYYEKIKAAGATLKCEPADRTYGMRDFAAFDLDGNQISFGCEMDET
ncbi:MAG: VOC family protein [Nibricoccus sp.]